VKEPEPQNARRDQVEYAMPSHSASMSLCRGEDQFQCSAQENKPRAG
jgi:hypothetical protein